MSNRTWVLNNLKPDGNACIFEQRTVDVLSLQMGDSVIWSFCNACETDMTVQLDTTGSGPFGLGTFNSFRPFPQADNLVSQTVPCHDFADIVAYGAKKQGEWKYSMRSKPVGPGNFPDVIDPRLEIDDTRFKLLLERLGFLLAGLVGGALIARRLKARS